MASGYCVVVTTVDSADAADQLAARALNARLAACVQVFPVMSHYVWDGARRKEPEFLLQIKTRDDCWDALAKLISEAHPYETPEILRTPITAGDPRYLRWIDEATDRRRGPPEA